TTLHPARGRTPAPRGTRRRFLPRPGVVMPAPASPAATSLPCRAAPSPPAPAPAAPSSRRRAPRRNWGSWRPGAAAARRGAARRPRSPRWTRSSGRRCRSPDRPPRSRRSSSPRPPAAPLRGGLPPLAPPASAAAGVPAGPLCVFPVLRPVRPDLFDNGITADGRISDKHVRNAAVVRHVPAVHPVSPLRVDGSPARPFPCSRHVGLAFLSIRSMLSAIRRGREAMADGALSRLRVLECGENAAAAYAGKLLGQLGADVVKLEPPGGDPMRLRGPFPPGPGKASPETSGLHLFLDQAKRSLSLDLETAVGQQALSELAREADVLIASGPPALLERWRLADPALREANPRLVVTLVTPFGL